MIWLDVTKTRAAARLKSGLTRVTSCLERALGDRARPCRWSDVAQGRVPLAAGDWWVTAEVFAPDERAGAAELLRARRCRAAAIYHDAIPLKLPEITWPRSVARHPAYLSLLAGFDCVFAVSAYSRDELVAFWRWQGRRGTPPVEVLPLGADGVASPRPVAAGPAAAASFVCVGILEPRKNQALALDAAEALWSDGIQFELHLVGRVNPHFGAPIERRIRTLRRRWKGLRHDGTAPDEQLSRLYRTSTATLVPTLAEGCGLPVLESLWHGTPVLSSDLPVLREHAQGGGCFYLPPNDVPAWAGAMRRLLESPGDRSKLAEEARQRTLPTWSEAAGRLADRLAGAPRSG